MGCGSSKNSKTVSPQKQGSQNGQNQSHEQNDAHAQAQQQNNSQLQNGQNSNPLNNSQAGKQNQNQTQQNHESLTGHPQSKLDLTADQIPHDNNLQIGPSPLINHLAHGSLAFNWKQLPYNKITMITAQFMYSYDTKSKQFKIQNDANRYTLSELQWTYLQDYDVYSIVLKDLKYVEVNNPKLTKDLKQTVDYEFDISPEGKFLGIPEVMKSLVDTFKVIGTQFEQSTDHQKQSVLKFLDEQLKAYWKGLVQNWVLTDPEEKFQVKSSKSNYFSIENSSALTNKIPTSQQKDKGIPIILAETLLRENPNKIRQYIEDKLSEDQEYFKRVELNTLPHPDTTKIHSLIERDQKLRQSHPSQHVSQIKFYETEKQKSYQAKLLSDLRPFICEQTQQKKVIFAPSNQNLTMDITYNSKITFCLWEDCKHLLTQDQILLEMNLFRMKNQQNLEQFKSQLKADGVMIK